MAQVRRRGTNTSAQLLTRPLHMADLRAVVELDARVTGEPKPEFWRHKIQKAADAPEVLVARVAEIAGRVVGVLIGEVRSWEFRLPPTGWITVLMVDPSYRRRGIGRRLLAEALDRFRERGLPSVRTMVAWSDGEMLSFFTAMGFDRGPFIELEKSLWSGVSGESSEGGVPR